MAISKAKKQPLNIILLGDPAAGKQTHAAELSKKHKMYDLDMGRELRMLDKGTKDSALKTVLDKTLNQGKLSPTKIVQEIFKHKFKTIPKVKGILFDGTPKMIGEARLVHKLLKETGRSENVKVIYLHVPEAESLRRMNSRVEYFKGKFSKRPDDNARALKNRIKYYRTNIKAVREYFDKIYGLHQVSSTGTIKEVSKRIEQILNEPDKNIRRNR